VTQRGVRADESDLYPPTIVVAITGIDPDGEALGRPVAWDTKNHGPPPVISMRPERKGCPALVPGERVLVRLLPATKFDAGGRFRGPRLEGRTIRRYAKEPGRILGVFRPGARESRLVPTDRRVRAEWVVPPGEDAGAAAGEIVLAEPLAHHHRSGPKPARVVQRLGNMGDARSVSLIAIRTHDIPVEFPEPALAEAQRARATARGRRTDLRGLPLVTIDDGDARDFDDAVFAEPDGGGGFRLIVAIADVAHYVRPGSALDHAARTRGTSVYFPDRVVPMLPEALSNGWCSLRPDEDRGCLFVEVSVDAGGHKRSHRFGRGVMRSAARLTYEEVQAMFEAGGATEGPPRIREEDSGAGSKPRDRTRHRSRMPRLPANGGAEDTRATHLAALIPHLYGAYHALLEARTARGTLDLDLPERTIALDHHGKVTSVAPRPRLESHRLIEEFMILANVAAADELERCHQPAMYRVHPPPSAEKLEALRGFVHTLGITLPPADRLHPRDLDRVLRRVAGRPEAPLVNEVILRSQSQAAYSPDNIGHFGLALPRYVHFTSPIRRYADLLVHRALIRGLKLGADGLGEDEAAGFEATAEHITATERRAQLAERDAVDRYLAAYMADKTGAHFAARISGVTRFALFVTVAESGASGIVPISTLPDDYWRHDETGQTLTGRYTGLVFRLAQEVEVRLAEASPVTGGLVFHVMQGMPRPKRRFRRR
jgi:ribonuclease R